MVGPAENFWVKPSLGLASLCVFGNRGVTGRERAFDIITDNTEREKTIWKFFELSLTFIMGY